MRLLLLAMLVALSTLSYANSADSASVLNATLTDTAKTAEEKYVVYLYEANETNKMLNNYGKALRKAYALQKTGLILVIGGSLVAVLVLPVGAAILLGGSIVSLVGTIKVWESGQMLRIKTTE